MSEDTPHTAQPKNGDPCVVCGMPGRPIPFRYSGSWTSPRTGETISVCSLHDPLHSAATGLYDISRAKIVAEALQLQREGRTRKPE